MLLVLPVYATLPGQRLFEAGWGTLLFQGVYQGLLATLASLVLFTRAVRALGAARTAIATSVTPTLATLLAIPLAGELPSAANLAGLALATAGMVVGVGGAATPRGSPPRR
jgi:drug/metabolite transporter (DMT)-like permease